MMQYLMNSRFCNSQMFGRRCFDLRYSLDWNVLSDPRLRRLFRQRSMNLQLDMNLCQRQTKSLSETH